MIVISSFALLLLVLIVSGILSNYSRKKQTNKQKLERYFVAGKNAKPILVALATFSTNTSAFMFTGFIGFTYFYGFSAIWLIFGWIVGDMISSFVFYKKMLKFTKTQSILSFPSLIVNLLNKNFKILKLVIALVSVIFVGCYAVAQIIGGGKVLSSVFNVNENWGSFLTISILALYCAYGGLKASMFVNMLQSIMMLFGVFILFSALVYDVGGIAMLLERLKLIDDSFRTLIPSYLSPKSNTVFFIIGWIFAGIGVVGMPHTVMQITTLDSVNHLNRMRFYYYFMYSTFSILTFLTGIGIRIYMPNLTFFQAESSFIETSKALLNPILHGFILASIFASIVSTIDSQTVACTSIISQDIIKKENVSISLVRILMILVLITLFFLSVSIQDTIFFLYRIAWSSLASAFSPLIFLIILGLKVSQVKAILMVLCGSVVSIAWYQVGLNSIIHEVFSGIISSFLIYIIIPNSLPFLKSNIKVKN